MLPGLLTSLPPQEACLELKSSLGWRYFDFNWRLPNTFKSLTFRITFDVDGEYQGASTIDSFNFCRRSGKSLQVLSGDLFER